MTTTTDISEADLARFESFLRRGETTFAHYHKSFDAYHAFPEIGWHIMIDNNTDVPATPLTTAEGREQWRELLKITPRYGTGFGWSVPELDGLPLMPDRWFDSDREAITAAVTAACARWKEQKDATN